MAGCGGEIGVCGGLCGRVAGWREWLGLGAACERRGREPMCEMSAHGVSGALGSGGFRNVCDGCKDEREGIWSVLKIRVVVS